MRRDERLLVTPQADARHSYQASDFIRWQSSAARKTKFRGNVSGIDFFILLIAPS